MSSTPEQLVAYLEHHPEGGPPGRRVFVRSSPFCIGRSDEADHTVYSREVSNMHAEILRVGDDCLVRDLGSKNGTFVNGQRVRERWLRDGDILHVATLEFRFGLAELHFEEEEPTLASELSDQQRVIRDSNNLERLLTEGAVAAFSQPIVQLSDGRVRGYEMLGRPRLADAAYDIGEVFRMAVERGVGGRLSRLLRRRALEVAPRLTDGMLFFNVHPTEMEEDDALLADLARIPERLRTGQRAVVEIHEAAVTDPKRMARLRARLSELGVGLAYDDFGAGQSRLMELVEVPPDYLKLDMALVRNIHLNTQRQKLVRALVEVMLGLGIVVLAEGVEHRAEAEVCAGLGCALGQGFLFGRPAPPGP